MDIELKGLYESLFECCQALESPEEVIYAPLTAGSEITDLNIVMRQIKDKKRKDKNLKEDFNKWEDSQQPDSR